MVTILRRLLFVLALVLPPAALAQETRVVAGVVVDAQTRGPVSDVLVTIQRTDLRAVTDAEGQFRVSGVPVGSQQLVLRHVAYGEHTQAVVVGASGPLDFQIPNAQLQTALSQHVAFRIELKLEPGSYRVAAAVLDGLGGVTGVATAPVVIAKK